MRIRLLLTTLLILGPGALPAQAGGDTTRAPLPIGVLLDSARLHRELVRVAPAPPGERRTRLFLVRFDSLGTPDSVAAVFPEEVAPGFREAVLPLLRAALRPIPKRPRGYRTMLLITAGDAPRIEAPALEETPPRLENPRDVQRRLQSATASVLDAHPELEGRRIQLRIRMVIEADGRISAASQDPPSGYATLDSHALAAAGYGRFQPATLEGRPIRVAVYLPLAVDYPAEPRPEPRRRP